MGNDYDTKNSPLFRRCASQLTGEYALSTDMLVPAQIIHAGLQVETIKQLRLLNGGKEPPVRSIPKPTGKGAV